MAHRGIISLPVQAVHGQSFDKFERRETVERLSGNYMVAAWHFDMSSDLQETDPFGIWNTEDGPSSASIADHPPSRVADPGSYLTHLAFKCSSPSDQKTVFIKHVSRTHEHLFPRLHRIESSVTQFNLDAYIISIWL